MISRRVESLHVATIRGVDKHHQESKVPCHDSSMNGFLSLFVFSKNGRGSIS
jgi:hypothetical protein